VLSAFQLQQVTYHAMQWRRRTRTRRAQLGWCPRTSGAGSGGTGTTTCSCARRMMKHFGGIVALQGECRGGAPRDLPHRPTKRCREPCSSTWSWDFWLRTPAAPGRG